MESQWTNDRRPEVYSLETWAQSGTGLGDTRPRWECISINHVEVENIPFRMHSATTSPMLPSILSPSLFIIILPPKNTQLTLFFLASLCGVWDLSFMTGIEPVPPTVEVWSLNHWTAREIPSLDPWTMQVRTVGDHLYVNFFSINTNYSPIQYKVHWIRACRLDVEGRL